ncbi:MAG TPA: glutathione S-transferase C-terminal domain-containing protein, partial [Usitatibacter sp.]|nr:glutathione S-transferase C-terminal domain-containing protein [Usitatibacter sp.]
TIASSVAASSKAAQKAPPSLGEIACGCALFWLEFRLPEFRWRDTHAGLKSWAQRLESRPSFATTRPPA